MKVVNCVQGSPEWLDARCGCATASRVAKIVNKLKNGNYSATRHTILMEIVAEMLTSRSTETFVSDAMNWGIETEPVARADYEIKTGNDVRLVGFVLHPTIERAGASPDGLVGNGGLLEIKCPNTVTHLEYLHDGVVPDEYKPQMLWQMACTERQWCDFVSFDPRLPMDYTTFVIRYQRDDARIKEMETEVTKFLAEADEFISKLPKGESVLA